MTCIVGIEHDGKVTLAGDSAGVQGLTRHIRLDEKVFRNGPFIMGFTTSFRMGQLLRYSFKPPKQKPKQDVMEYLVVDVMDAIRDTFDDKGFLSVANEDDEGKSGAHVGGDFLMGYKGKLYVIESDFQVAQISDGYAAVGCGTDLAMGSLHSTGALNGFYSNIEPRPKNWVSLDPQTRLTMALDAAAAFNAGVAPPYNFVTL